MKHRKKTVIRTRFPTMEEAAKVAGVSKKRLAEIIKILEDIWKEEAEKTCKSKKKPRK